jgi:chromosome segregation ATPase
MIKKLVFLAAVGAAGLFALNSVCGHGSVHTFWKRTQAQFERKISPEFELDRIRGEIAKLTPDMHRNISKIAEEIVAVQTLEFRVNDLQARLDKSKDTLALYTQALEGTTKVSVGGREVAPTPAKVKECLRNCKNLDKEVTSARKVLEAKKAGLDAARQQLAEMRQQKEQLEVMVAEYEAQWKTLQLEQTRAKLKLDDSRLADIKAAIEKLRERIEVERQTAALAETFNAGGDFKPEKKSENAKDVAEEAREFLGHGDKADAAKK